MHKAGLYKIHKQTNGSNKNTDKPREVGERNDAFAVENQLDTDGGRSGRRV